MQTTQQPSTFAQIVDKLRNKSEEELRLLHAQLLISDKTTEASAIVAENSGSYHNDKNIKKGKTSGKQNSLDDVFGIWKDKNITLNSIRKEAWQRKK